MTRKPPGAGASGPARKRVNVPATGPARRREPTKRAVKAVTGALIDAGLAFSYSPFVYPAWFLEFEDGTEQRLFLSEDGRQLMLTSLVPPGRLGAGEGRRTLGEGVWLERVPSGELVAVASLAVDDLAAIRGTVYGLRLATFGQSFSDALDRLEQRAEDAPRGKKQSKASAGAAKRSGHRRSR